MTSFVKAKCIRSIPLSLNDMDNWENPEAEQPILTYINVDQVAAFEHIKDDEYSITLKDLSWTTEGFQFYTTYSDITKYITQ